jgi:hypothetical protein
VTSSRHTPPVIRNEKRWSGDLVRLPDRARHAVAAFSESNQLRSAVQIHSQQESEYASRSNKSISADRKAKAQCALSFTMRQNRPEALIYIAKIRKPEMYIVARQVFTATSPGSALSSSQYRQFVASQTRSSTGASVLSEKFVCKVSQPSRESNLRRRSI